MHVHTLYKLLNFCFQFTHDALSSSVTQSVQEKHGTFYKDLNRVTLPKEDFEQVSNYLLVEKWTSKEDSSSKMEPWYSTTYSAECTESISLLEKCLDHD